MTSFLDGVELEDHYDVIEFFSGTARVSRMAKSMGYTPLALGIRYDNTVPPPKQKKKKQSRFPNARSAMDLTGSAGFLFLVGYGYFCRWSMLLFNSLHYLFSAMLQLRLAIVGLLRSKFQDVLTLWGICCSSWVKLNAGTSKRSYLTPMGSPLIPSVRAANGLVSR